MTLINFPTDCDSCGETAPSVTVRELCSDATLCDLCYGAALAHGHAHGLHTERLADCPCCHETKE